MAKQALGRNLQALSHDEGKAPRTAASPAASRAPLGPGVRSLMTESPFAAPNQPLNPSRRSLPGWYLFAADFLLASVALLVVWKSPHPLSWPKELFCVMAVLLGAGLALTAVFLQKGSAKLET